MKYSISVLVFAALLHLYNQKSTKVSTYVIKDNYSFNVSFYNSTHLEFSTELAEGEYIAIGFYKYMMDCEMLAFETAPF